MIIQKPFFSKVLATIYANERTLTSMDAIVNTEMRFSSISLITNGADKRLFSGVHSDVLLQGVVVVARLFAYRTHEIRRF
jgi:hypothetical protein